MNRRILSQVLLAVALVFFSSPAFLSSSGSALAASPAVVTVGDPDIGCKPKNEGDFKSLEKWLILQQEAGLINSGLHVRTQKTVEESIKNKTKVPPARYVALANIVVLSVDKSRGDQSKDIFEVFEDKNGNLQVPDGRGGGPELGKPYMLDLTMKLVDIRTTEIMAVSADSFKGSKWTGWPDAKKLDSTDLMKDEVAKRLSKALKNSCQNLADQLNDKKVSRSSEAEAE